MPTIPGLTPGNYYQGGAGAQYGMSLGTPRDWSHGGMQYYDPKYVRPLRSEVGSNPGTVANRTNPGVKPSSGGGQTGGSGFSQSNALSLPWQSGGGGFGNISTSITPRPIYSDALTRDATNFAVADQHKAGFVPDLLKRYDRQGVSRGAGQLAKAMGDSAGYNQAARRASVELPMEDAFANTQALLGGQVAREGEAQGLAAVMLKLMGNNQDLRFGLARDQNDFLGTGLNLASSLFN